MNGMKKLWQSGRRVGVGCAAFVWVIGAGAAELDWSISAGATYSDNIGRAGTNEESDTSADLGLRLNYSKRDGRLDANVASDLMYRSYFDGAYSDELVGSLAGSATYWFVPERFSWVVQDNFGQTLIDRQAVDNPGNRQNTNYFSTGPNFILRLGSRTDLSLQGRWSDASYESTDTDNQRLSGSVGLIRRLSETRSISLNGTAARVEYAESPPNSDYDTQSAFLGFDAEGARTSLNLQAGYTALHDFGDTSDGPLFNLSVTRQVSARSTLSLNVGTNLTDSAEDFRRYQDIGVVSLDTETTAVSRDSYQSDYASVAWALSGERNTLRLSADWRQEDHERDDDFNRDSIGAAIDLSRRLGQALSASLYGSWRNEDFSSTGVDFDEWSVGAGVTWQVSRDFSASLRATHNEGSGDTSTGNGVRDYKENTVSLHVTYSPGR